MKTWLSWSSGKDSAWSLVKLRERDDVEVTALLTTFNASAERVAMHAVRRELARVQARAVGLPLVEVDLPYPCPNEEYEARMRAACDRAVAAGVACIAFGDLFLADVRAYRERQLAATRLAPLFPLWGADTSQLARAMVAGGLRAILTCVDPKQLDPGFAGRTFDAALLADLPAGVDPCGENGEFHTFVTHAPCFERPLDVRVGEIVERDGFVFADVLPDSA
jgi:uncharacterized protein (TIGR00290 family)